MDSLNCSSRVGYIRLYSFYMWVNELKKIICQWSYKMQTSCAEICHLNHAYSINIYLVQETYYLYFFLNVYVPLYFYNKDIFLFDHLISSIFCCFRNTFPLLCSVLILSWWSDYMANTGEILVSSRETKIKRFFFFFFKFLDIGCLVTEESVLPFTSTLGVWADLVRSVLLILNEKNDREAASNIISLKSNIVHVI